MLTYISSGIRDFGTRPIRPYRRHVWEFYAVLRGRISPVFAIGERPEIAPALAKNALWVFRPESEHGWRGEKHQHASVAVFHFDRVPSALSVCLTGRDVIQLGLTQAQSCRVFRLARELQPLLLASDPLIGLESERAVSELAVLVLRKFMALPVNLATSIEDRVKVAERWFGENLELRPSLESVACKLGVSTAHLRRMFVEVRGEAPKAVLDRIRLSHAKHLLTSGNLKLEAVAAYSGYASASVFVQAFRKAMGVTPDVWRKERLASVE